MANRHTDENGHIAWQKKRTINQKETNEDKKERHETNMGETPNRNGQVMGMGRTTRNAVKEVTRHQTHQTHRAHKLHTTHTHVHYMDQANWHYIHKNNTTAHNGRAAITTNTKLTTIQHTSALTHGGKGRLDVHIIVSTDMGRTTNEHHAHHTHALKAGHKDQTNT